MRRSLAALLIITASPAAADSPPPDTVLVTATRLDERVLDLPGNASVVERQSIEFTQAERPAELLDQLPGVNIQQGGGEEHLAAIRSPVLNGGAGQGSILYLEDGVPLRAAGFGNVNALYEANIEQAGSVEVIRGPGSALYGSNAVHGLVNVIPRAPAAQSQQEIGLTAGMFGLWEGAGSISDTVGNDGWRLSFEDHHDSGWRDHTRLDEQKWVGRNVWTGTSDTLTTTVSGQNLNQERSGYLLGQDSYLNYALAKTNPLPDDYRRADSFRAATRWQHDFGGALQLSVTPYARYSEMGFVMDYLPTDAVQDNAHYSVGVQNALYVNFPDGGLLMIGLDAEYTDGWYSEFQTRPTFKIGNSVYPQGLHYDLDAAAKSIAPYLHSEWQIFETTRLTAGIRAEATGYDYSNKAATGIFGLYQRPANRADQFLTITPKLGLVHQWQPSLASYVNFSRGARAPQVTDLYELQNKQLVGQVKAESVDSAEIGSRGTLSGITFDMAAYWMSKDHYFYRAADGTNVPDGKTWHRGVELGLSAPLPAGFDLALSASYARHTYEFNRPDSTIISSVTKGTDMPEAPHGTANTRLGYNFAPGTRAELEWMHMGAYFLDNADTHRYGGHELLNFRLAAPLGETVTLHAKIINLTNRAYADRAAITTTGVDEYFPGAPLTLSAGVSARF